MTNLDDDIYETAWITLARGHQAVLDKIENALKSAELPPLGWYDVLLELSRSEGEGVRAFELESRLLLPQYGLSRLLDRIEKAGFLERQVCKSDRRGKHLYITRSGEAIRKKMWPVYQKAIMDIFEKKISRTEAVKFIQTLSKLRV